jgi:hypothetical protein
VRINKNSFISAKKNLTIEYKMSYRMKTRRNKNKNNEMTMGGKRRKTEGGKTRRRKTHRGKTHRRRHSRKN